MIKTTMRRRRSGFTLAEVMVVVAIIVILVAIAIPSVMVLRKNLKMTELDSCARDIFIATQNNLTGLKSQGLLPLLGGSPVADPESTPDADGDFRCLTSGEAGMDRLLPAGAIDGTVAANHYVIIFDAKSATVLDVYYAEQPMSSDDAMALRDDPDKRRDTMVGYYGGSNVKSNPSVTQDLPTPMVSIQNGDELTVNVTVDLTGMDASLISNLSLALLVSDGTKEATITVPPLAITGGTVSVSQVLDSLTGEHFREVCATLTPGADLTVTATLTYGGSAGTYLPATSSPVKANSLFASRSGSSVGITYPRHLQNLDTATSGVSNQVTSAVQNGAITWPVGITFVPIENTALKAYDGSKVSIRNLVIAPRPSAASAPAGLFGALANGVTLQGIRIENATLTSTTGGDSGLLVGTANAVTITDCMAYVISTEPYKTLAANYPVSGTGNTGGLIGSATDCTISYSAAGLPKVSGGSDNGFLGGLVGYAITCPSITNSYAAIDQLSGRAIKTAMFIGQADNCPQIADCYAAGNISAETPLSQYAGEQAVMNISGFVSGNPAASYKNTYCAVSYLDETGKTRDDLMIMFNFTTNRLKNGKIKNCAYMQTNTKTYNANIQEGEVLTYKELKTWNGGGAFGTAQPEYSFPYQEGLRGQSYPFRQLAGQDGNPIRHYGSWPVEPEISVGEGEGVAYLEQYEDNTYGYFCISMDGKISNTLSNSKPIKQFNGKDPKDPPTYGILLNEGTALDQLGMVSFESTGKGDEVSAESIVFSSNGQGAGGDNRIKFDHKIFYPFKPATIKTLNNSCYSNTDFAAPLFFHLSGAVTKYYVNPNFGAAIVRNPSGFPWVEGHPMQIRTVDQLTNMGTRDATHIYYKQTHHIDASEFPETGSRIFQNQQTFDGNGYEITNLKEPLFTRISAGTLKNITIRGADIKADNTGILAFTTDSSAAALIDNCKVLDSSITGDNVAGLVHTSSFPIRNSSVQNTTITATGSAAAGFVFLNRGAITNAFSLAHVTGKNVTGFVYENEGTISSCYTNATIAGTSSASGFVASTSRSAIPILNCYSMGTVAATDGVAAGLIGKYTWNYPPKSCYSAATVTGKTAYGFAPLDGTPLSNCFYLDQSDLSIERQAGTATNAENWPSITSSLGAAWELLSGNLYPTLRGVPHYALGR